MLLPGLVFEAAYKIDLGELRRTSAIVALLAAPGVLVTAAVVAVVVSTVTGLGLGPAFLLGAIISATDPVAVVALFRRLHAPARLSTAVEAESLFNDGTGVVLFAIALTAVSSRCRSPRAPSSSWSRSSSAGSSASWPGWSPSS